jgi:hypothetical protein
MNNSVIRAPIDRILPSFAPVIFERGIPGYATEELSLGETRILAEHLRPLLIASGLIGAWSHALEHGFDSDRVLELLMQSVEAIPDFSPTEAKATLDLVNRFLSYRIIREDHSLDNWLCEALWPAFQAAPYSYPSAMSRVMSYALEMGNTLRKMALEY